LIAVFLIGSLLISCFIALAKSTQPPIDISTYYLEGNEQPTRLDPARAYDQASGELLQNVYQTLIWWTDKHSIIFTPGVGYNLTIADYADLDQYGPVLATEVPTVANGRIVFNASGSYWRFTINTDAQFQSWMDHLGVVQPARNITAADVVYSFRRQVIYESPYGPTSMWMSSAFGVPSWRDVDGGLYATYNNGTFQRVVDEAAAAALITNWCYNVDNDVYFYFQPSWAEGVLKQTFAQTWGGVVNPDWVNEMGGWDGLFTTGVADADMSAGWTNNYHWKPTDTRSELDTYKSPSIYNTKGSKYASFTRNMVGTGPYKFTSWDTTNKIWRIDYNPAYWIGWAQAGDKAGNYIHTVIEKTIGHWPTTEMMFLDGDFDEVDVPSANYSELETTPYNPIPGINEVYNIPSLDRRWTRDWVQGWYYNALLPGDYFYDLYKTTSTLQNVDIQLTQTPPATPGVLAPLQPIPRVLLCPQSGWLLIGRGNPAPANNWFTLYVVRVDNNPAVQLLWIVIGLQIRAPNGLVLYTYVAIVALASNTWVAVTLWWYGSYNWASVGVYGSQTGVPWTVSAVAAVIWPPAQLNSIAVLPLGTVTIFTLVADVVNDGIVDIYDAIALANAFGSSTGQVRYNRYADLNGDGAIDIFDAILLAGNFNRRAPP
jgi:hypothetical protein